MGRGFTLLEVLVAMAMTAIIMAGLYGAYSSNVDTIQGARQNAEASQTARIALDLMVKDLESVMTGEGLGVTGTDRTIEGRPADRLVVSATRGGILGETGPSTDLRTITYDVEEDPEGDDLILYRSEEGLAGPGVSTGRVTYALARNVKALDIVYEDRGGRESEEWSMGDGENKEQLPALIRIRLVLAAGPDRELVFTTGVHPDRDVYETQ